MVNEIKDRMAALKARKQAIVKRVQEMSPERQTKQPKDRGFTPVQLIAHLAKTEEYYLRFQRRTPPQSLVGRTPRLGPFYGLVLGSCENLKRVPAPPMVAPERQPDLAVEIDRWNAASAEVEANLAGVSDPDSAFLQGNFMFGLLSARQYLALLEGHLKYHEHYFPQV